MEYHEKLIVNLGAQDSVRFTGGISRSKVPLYYAASDIVVVPSLQEGFCIVVFRGNGVWKTGNSNEE